MNRRFRNVTISTKIFESDYRKLKTIGFATESSVQIACGETVFYKCVRYELLIVRLSHLGTKFSSS